MRIQKHRTPRLGDRFGEWTVIGDMFTDVKLNPEGKKRYRSLVPCECKCGFRSNIPKQNLVHGYSTRCRKCAQLGGFDDSPRPKPLQVLTAASVAELVPTLTDAQLLEARHAIAQETASRRAVVGATSIEGDRPLPSTRTDWDLFEDLVRVHKSMTSDSSWSRDLYDWWATWNQLYFGQTLRPLFIYSGLTEYGKFLGVCKYYPTREILIQKQGVNSPPVGQHHGASVRRHEAFADLTDHQYSVALIVLHEMIHQACFEAGVDPEHQGAPWAAHCNAIGRDLGLRLTYSPMSRGKVTKCLPDGGKNRINVWKPQATELLPGTHRFASIVECRSFPYIEGDAFLEVNSTLATTGEEVTENGGRPVFVPPKF